MIILDTSGVLAAIDRSQRLHHVAAVSLRDAEPPRLLSPFVLGELDYLLTTRVGIDAELRLLDEVARGAYMLAAFSADDVDAARSLIERYRDLDIGLADASLVVLAERYGTNDLLTLDERHFRAVTKSDGAPFRLLPLDA
ncbi:MAG: PIN domain-containing protein [Candidatus Limnocylindrales bacterium]